MSGEPIIMEIIIIYMNHILCKELIIVTTDESYYYSHVSGVIIITLQIAVT